MEDVEAQMAFRKPFARMFMRGKRRQIARKRSTVLKLGGGKIPKFKAVSLLRHELHGLGGLSAAHGQQVKSLRGLRPFQGLPAAVG